MSLNVYKVGEAVNLKADFEVAGVDTDPGSVTLKIVDPVGNTTFPAPVHDSTGHYHYNQDLTGATPGVWNVNWLGTSPAQGTRDDKFLVEATAV